MGEIIIILIVVVVAFWHIYYFRDIDKIIVFNKNSNKEELMQNFKNIIKNTKSDTFYMHGGELNYETHEKLSPILKEYLTRDKKNKIVIYCGPIISIKDKDKNYVNDEGYLKKTPDKNTMNKLHPTLALKNEFEKQITIRLKKTDDDAYKRHFLYGNNDDIYWIENEHIPFETVKSFINLKANKKNIEKLKDKSQELDKISEEITLTNIKERSKFYTKDMFNV